MKSEDSEVVEGKMCDWINIDLYLRREPQTQGECPTDVNYR